MELALFIYLAETICTKGGESGYAFLLGIFFVLSIVAIIMSRVDPKEFGNLATQNRHLHIGDSNRVIHDYPLPKDSIHYARCLWYSNICHHRL